MTTEVQEVRPHQAGAVSVVACGHCLRRLAGEYFFTCLKCKASYCYIHMSRHQPALCARREARLQPAPQQPSERLDQQGRVPLVRAGSRPASRSSANV
jgi:hypothetical protein